MPDGAIAFSVAPARTGYLSQLTPGVRVVTGILLPASRFVPLALALPAPVVVNIFAFHVFLAPVCRSPSRWSRWRSGWRGRTATRSGAMPRATTT